MNHNKRSKTAIGLFAFLLLTICMSDPARAEGFDYSFDSTYSGWEIAVSGRGGRLSLTTKDGASALAGSFSSDLMVSHKSEYTDFIFEARVYLRGSGRGHVGVCFRSDGDVYPWGYMLSLNHYADGETGFSVGKGTLGMTGLQGRTHAASVRSGWNEVRIRAAGSNIQIHINGSLAFEADDSNHSSGRVGFYTDGMVNDIYVDWARLTTDTGGDDDQPSGATWEDGFDGDSQAREPVPGWNSDSYNDADENTRKLGEAGLTGGADSYYQTRNGELQIQAAEDSFDRMKLMTSTDKDFRSGVYEWRVWVGADFVEPGANSAVAAWVYSEEPYKPDSSGENDKNREVDFEVAYGTDHERNEAAKKHYYPWPENTLVLFMTVQATDGMTGSDTERAPIQAGYWYIFRLEFTTNEYGNYRVSWKYKRDGGGDGFLEGRDPVDLAYGPSEVSWRMVCSVENFSNMKNGFGEAQPTRHKYGAFDWVRYTAE